MYLCPQNTSILMGIMKIHQWNGFFPRYPQVETKPMYRTAVSFRLESLFSCPYFFFGNRRYLVESSCSITNLGPHHLDRNLAVSKNRVYPQFFQFHRMESPRAVMTLNSSLYFLKPPDNRGVYPQIASNSHVNSMGKIDVLIHWNWGVSRT